MAGIEGLLHNYQGHVSIPWESNLAGAQKVWFAVYNPMDERRLRTRIGEFETATKRAGHGWHQLDLTTAFARWMAAEEYRDSYFQAPEDLDMALSDFEIFTSSEIEAMLTAASVDAESVCAVFGIASLFGLCRVSKLLESVGHSIRGRFLVFFPGERDDANYRLLDARDGWNYLAIPITSQESI